MSTLFKPIQTADLLHDDAFNSADGRLEQSLHVFINGNNLINRWQTLSPNYPTYFNIGELGFGRGLNFLNTWHLWEQHAPSTAILHFISSEKHPLKKDDLVKRLKNWPMLASQAQQLIDSYPILTPGYHHLSFEEGRINLTLMLGDALEQFEQLLICGESRLEAQLRTSLMDAWYLNGFSPKTNQDLTNIIAMLSKKGTSLTTYKASPSVKSLLSEMGFKVEKIPGFAPQGHMIRAVFEQGIKAKLKTRQTPWHINKAVQFNNKSALIIGAGLAGSFTAHFLAKKGWKVTLIEELKGVGQAGSANPQAVLFPKLSAYQSPFTQLMLFAFLFASRFYKNYFKSYDIGKLSGSLSIAYNEKEKKLQESLREWLIHYPELGQLVEAEQASELAGLSLEHTALFLPLSGWINSPLLCASLIEDKNITLVTNHQVDSLIYEEELWWANGYSAPVLIIANGPQANSFTQTNYLPLKAVRGQMTAIASTANTSLLKIPLCAQGHVLPEYKGMHYCGATYQLSAGSSTINSEDDEANRIMLTKMIPSTLWSKDIKHHWAGIRATTTDYLPLVGPLPKEDEFLSLFKPLKDDAKLWIAQAGTCHQGLYMCAGFGSRGLTTIPLCAYWLASSINGELDCLPRNLIQALSPARFLYRTLIRKKM